MDTQDQRPFIIMLTSLFRMQQSVADLFFQKRLSEEIEHIIDRHIKYEVTPSQQSGLEYLRNLKALEKVLQEILYLEKSEIVPLAISREQVLKYIYNLLLELRAEKEKPIETIPKPVSPKTERSNHNLPVIHKPTRDKLGLSKAQEKILEFVRQAPDCRTKDVVSQFSALSPRTVKRGLKELNEIGKIIKRLDGGAVYYSAV